MLVKIYMKGFEGVKLVLIKLAQIWWWVVEGCFAQPL